GLEEPLCQGLPYEARDEVRRKAGREANDDAHRPRRIGLRPRDPRYGRQRGSAGGEMQKLSSVGKFHAAPAYPHDPVIKVRRSKRPAVRNAQAAFSSAPERT